jgi:hypothetical protein
MMGAKGDAGMSFPPNNVGTPLGENEELKNLGFTLKL